MPTVKALKFQTETLPNFLLRKASGLVKASVLLSVLVSLALPAMAQPATNSTPTATPTFAEPGSVWSLNVVGLKGESLGILTLELTDESASTCMSGEWKKSHLIQSSFQSLAEQFETKDYFPTYEADGQVLTIN